MTRFNNLKKLWKFIAENAIYVDCYNTKEVLNEIENKANIGSTSFEIPWNESNKGYTMSIDFTVENVGIGEPDEDGDFDEYDMIITF